MHQINSTYDYYFLRVGGETCIAFKRPGADWMAIIKAENVRLAATTGVGHHSPGTLVCGYDHHKMPEGSPSPGWVVGYFPVHELQEIALYIPPECGTSEEAEIGFAMTHGDLGVDASGHALCFFRNTTNVMFTDYAWDDLFEEQQAEVRDYWRSFTREEQERMLVPGVLHKT